MQSIGRTQPPRHRVLPVAIGLSPSTTVDTARPEIPEFVTAPPPLRILGSLAWQYRRLWKVKDLLRQAGRDGEAARQLRMDASQVRPFLGQFAESHLRDALGRCLVTDSRLKGGSGGRPELVLDRLILELCDRPQDRERKPPEPPGAGFSRTKTLSNVRTISGKPPKNSRAG